MKKLLLLIFFGGYTTLCFSQQNIEVPYYESRGKFGSKTVRCNINGYDINMIFDTGADFILLSKKQADAMEKLGHIRAGDYTGKKVKYMVASGDSVEGREILLRSFKIAAFSINNVYGVVTADERHSEPLLGQSVIALFSRILIDNEKKQMVFTYNPDTTIAISTVNCKDSLTPQLMLQKTGLKDMTKWYPYDYAKVIAYLEKVGQECPAQLPRVNSEIFKKVAEQSESMHNLKNVSHSTDIKINIINAMIRQYLKLEDIYKNYPDEMFELSKIHLDVLEEMMPLLIETKTKLADDEERKHKESILQMVGTHFTLSNRKVPEKPEVTAYLIKYLKLFPSFSKFIGSSFKNIVRERLFAWSEIEQNEQVRHALKDAFSDVVGKMEVEKDWVERLKKNPLFVKSCIAYEGKFMNKDKEDKLVYKLTSKEVQPELILNLTSNKRVLSGKVTTTEGIKTSHKEFDVSGDDAIGMTSKLTALIIELYGKK